MSELKKKLFVWSYDPHSESAELLANTIGVYRIKHESSTFSGSPEKYIINWGASPDNWQSRLDGSEVFNEPRDVSVAINKKKFFQRVGKVGGPRLPVWTDNPRTSLGWLDTGKVVARQRLTGYDGNGLVLMNGPRDFVDAKLYTKFQDSDREYRVYVFNNRVVDARIKVVKQGHEVPKVRIRVGDAWGYDPFPIRRLEPDVVVQAEKAATLSRLLFGGVDVLVKDGRATVLEMNTAPYLGINTARVYANCFIHHMNEIRA